MDESLKNVKTTYNKHEYDMVTFSGVIIMCYSQFKKIKKDQGETITCGALFICDAYCMLLK